MGLSEMGEDAKLYYFITYQAETFRDGYISVWNRVIEGSPIKFILDAAVAEESGGNFYKNFAITNTLKITKEEYETYKDTF